MLNFCVSTEIHRALTELTKVLCVVSFLCNMALQDEEITELLYLPDGYSSDIDGDLSDFDETYVPSVRELEDSDSDDDQGRMLKFEVNMKNPIQTCLDSVL